MTLLDGRKSLQATFAPSAHPISSYKLNSAILSGPFSAQVERLS
jgi:hypothetical protein